MQLDKWKSSPARLTLIAACAVFSVCSTGPTQAMDHQSHDSIRNTAQAFLSDKLTNHYIGHDIRIGVLDPRLQLTSCEKNLEAFSPPGSRLPGNTTVGVRCTGPKPWSVYLTATVSVRERVLVAKRPLVRGAPIGKADVAVIERDTRRANNDSLREATHAIGKLAKRAVSAGTVLTAAMLDAPALVQRGQRVILLAELPGFEVRMTGTALMNGARGDVVQVRNASSRRTVQGVVLEPGVVRIHM